ncbi:MAG: SUMF1/EgtB/PvdO family nonheme iron enzyme [Pirellulaceae bacterium]
MTYVRRHTNRFVVDNINPAGQLPELVGDRSSWRIASSLKAKTFRNSEGIEMVRIPSGNRLRYAYDAATQEAHEVSVYQPDFLVGKHKVTVGQFRRFVDATGFRTVAELASVGDLDGLLRARVPRIEGGVELSERLPQFYGLGLVVSEEGKSVEQDRKFSWRNVGWEQSDDHPVLNLSDQDVAAYLKWLSEKENRSYRVCDFSEWQFVLFGSFENFSQMEAAKREESYREVAKREQMDWLRLRPIEINGSRVGIDEDGNLLNWEAVAFNGSHTTTTVMRKSHHSSGLVGLFSNGGEWICNDASEGDIAPSCQTFGGNGVCSARPGPNIELIGFRVRLVED